jgi:UDP-sugar pyrophosphorylase
VLVAGGLGERLGFSGIKLALPVDLASEDTYLGTYCASILALQRRFAADDVIPLAIMTSDDTHARTLELLEANNHFGMALGQVRLRSSRNRVLPASFANAGRCAVGW